MIIPRRQAHLLPNEVEQLREELTHPERDAGAVAEWERTVADYVGVPHAAAVSSGRRAMTLIFKYLGVGSGTEVIIPAYTLKDLIPLIQGLGATAVPADIDPATLNADPAAVEARISPRTRAILVLHAFGSPCRIEEIVELGAKRGIPVVEDCAHSLGATSGGAQTGSFGTAAFFSFETTKPVNTFGGGMVVSSDRALIDAVHAEVAGARLDPGVVERKLQAVLTERKMFRTGLCFPMLLLLAMHPTRRAVSQLYRRFQHAPPGDIAYLPLQARLGMRKLASLGERIRHREACVELLRSALGPAVPLQAVRPGCLSTWYFAAAVLPRPAFSVRRKLLLRGIDAGVEDEVADDCAMLLGDEGCPNAGNIFGRALALPMFDGIKESVVRRVGWGIEKRWGKSSVNSDQWEEA